MVVLLLLSILLATLGPAATSAHDPSAYGGLFRSRDDGASWFPADPGLFLSGALGMAISPVDANHLLLATDTGLLRSRNGGRNWIREAPTALFGGVYAVAFGAEGQGALASTAAQIYRTDDGSLWRETSAPDGAAPAYAIVLGLVAGRIYMAGPGGLWRSDDRGGSWSGVGEGLPEGAVNGLVVTGPEETVYAIAGGRIWMSPNGARSWHARHAGLPEGRVEALTPDPMGPDRLWVAAADRVFASADRGLSWHPVGRPLPEANTAVHGIAASAALVLGIGVIVWRFGLRFDPGFIEYPMLRSTDIPTAVAVAPDGAVWFTIEFSNAIGLWRNGKIERLTKATHNLEPIGLAVASDGSAWYTDSTARVISRISRSGEVTSFPLSTPIAKLGRLAVAADGSVWFAESTSYSVTQLKDGAFTRYVIESGQGSPYGVAVDAHGTVWATLQNANKLVQISLQGEMTEIEVPTRASSPTDIAVDAAGAVWFLEFRANQIGRYADGRFAEFRVPGDGKAALTGLAVTPDGSSWFGMLRAHSLGRLRHGSFRTFHLPRSDARPYSVAADAAGNVWYADISGWLGTLPADRAKRD